MAPVGAYAPSKAVHAKEKKARPPGMREGGRATHSPANGGCRPWVSGATAPAVLLPEGSQHEGQHPDDDGEHEAPYHHVQDVVLR